MKEEFKQLVRWVQECTVEAAMKIDELKGQIEQQQQEIERLQLENKALKETLTEVRNEFIKAQRENEKHVSVVTDYAIENLNLKKQLQQAQEEIERQILFLHKSNMS
ncbi:hypothetical protein [Thermaerobacillus caldiproteolyticus]|uniref:hypothetical protein n=1 Tax=Thermaerobacillus caldiproteolyticus TaxID=247480 RepID=UPI00188A5B85|nr:hypothetical protein [Anoxybacillus caldiproteolyticus]QPA33415.1 hypothetical protein ISX45_19020 [Anoxybacillus caldiproteolyticus]